MPKSRKRKKAKTYKQVIPVQKKIPVAPIEVLDEKTGKKSFKTQFAVVKTNQTRVVKHLPQKKG
jgi:hypothetical protein